MMQIVFFFGPCFLVASVESVSHERDAAGARASAPRREPRDKDVQAFIEKTS